jgi:YYY domain-containing protein
VARLRALLGWAGGTGQVLVWGLLLGSLAFLNTWDYPIYLALVAAALAIARYRREPQGTTWLSDTTILVVVLGLVGVVAYLPFFLSLRTQAGGIGAVPLHIKTQLKQFLLMFGVQIALVLGMLAAMLPRLWAGLRVSRPPVLAWIWAGLFAAGTLAALVATWWTAALCLFILWLAGTLLIWEAVRWARQSSGEPGVQSLFVLIMVVFGALLLLAVEFVYLRDVFDSRMNTVFKFYYQGWVLLSLSGAYGAWYLVRGLRDGGRAMAIVRALWLVVCVLLVAAGLSYTAAATVSKANGFGGTPTLNGTAYVTQQRPLQYGVIEWLRAEAEPDAVIVEAAGGSYTAQNWVSAQTGLSSLLGWAGHERQWRGSGALPAERETAVNSIYTGADVGETRRLLEDYGVDYVIVGPDEREQYGVGAVVLAKLDELMARAFENEAYVVFARTW